MVGHIDYIKYHIIPEVADNLLFSLAQYYRLCIICNVLYNVQSVVGYLFHHLALGHSSFRMLLARRPKKGTSHLSSVSAVQLSACPPSLIVLLHDLPSLYALMVKYPINPKSPIRMTHDKNVDHENIKCSTKIAENSNADCHAWNLPTNPSAPFPIY